MSLEAMIHARNACAYGSADWRYWNQQIQAASYRASVRYTPPPRGVGLDGINAQGVREGEPRAADRGRKEGNV
jgi:hypothetical protein